MAVAALTSCFQNEELSGVGGNNAIAFDNAYVGNATKAIDGSFDNNNLNLFQVYGTVNNTSGTANIFNGVEVSKATGVWAYADEYTQYWVAGNNYCFKAVVAGNEAGETSVTLDALNMPTAIVLSNASAQNDILYAEVLNVNYANDVQPVKFTFSHLLAKAKVTVKDVSEIANGGYYVVKNVYLKKALNGATYTIGEGWASYNGTYDLQFGDIVAPDSEVENAEAIQLPLGTGVAGASNYERLIIPQNDCELTIVVDYTYYNNGLAQQTVENKEIKTVANIEAGKAYNFVLALAEPGEPITFDVEAVTDWVEGGIKTAADLKDAVAAGGTVFLAKDIDLGNEKLVVPAGKSVVLNLNGHTVSQTKACTESYEMISNKGNLTIMGNGKLSFKDTSAGDPTFGWGSYTIRNEGTLVVEDGVIEHLGEQNFATHMICAIFQYSGSTTINGGTISTPNYRSARLWKGDMTINGGKFNGQVWVHAVDDSAVLTINGGNFAPSGVDGSSVFVSNAEHTVNLAVNGGYFNTKIGTSDANKAGVKGTIKGGSFTESAKTNTNTALLATGYGFVATEGGSLWNVIKAAYVSTPAALKDAVAANEKTIYVQGEIDLANVILSGYNGTIVGADETAVLNTRNFTPSANEAYQLRCTTLNVKNLTIKVPAEDGDYLKSGFVGTGALTFDNCVFEGQVTLNGSADWTFNKCVFGGVDVGAYASFVYGAAKATFNNCSFSGVDRAAKVYGTGGTLNVEYNNCTFASTTANKYAVNIDANYATTTVALNACSQTGMPGLYKVEGSKATVIVDGVQQ